MKTIQELAGEYREFFTTFKRGKSDKVLYKTTDDAPEKVKDMVREAHGDLLPDDYVYYYIDDALCLIQDLDDDNLDCPYIEPDYYNHQLTDWLTSNAVRGAYVDEAVNDGYVSMDNFDIYVAIAAGQVKEKEEVCHSVLSWLREEIENMDEEVI